MKLRLTVISAITSTLISFSWHHLTVFPSNDVVVNQRVTLLCELDSDTDPPFLAIFYIQPPYSRLCALEPRTGVCKNTTDPCRTLYNASCPSNTRYSIQVNVSQNWNNVSVVCQSLFDQSNRVIFFVRGILLITLSCSM